MHKILIGVIILVMTIFIAFFNIIGQMYSEQKKLNSMTETEAIEYVLSLDDEERTYFLNHISRPDAEKLQKELKMYNILLLEEEDKFEN